MGVVKMKQKISGALNPLCDKAIRHSDIAYESIRKSTTDIHYISRNTNFSYEQVSLIKSHIFFSRHILKSGRVARFDPSYEMAESWRRLSNKSGKGIQQHDVLMLYHELLEIQYISQEYSQSESHELASKKFDYSSASNDYYRSLGFNI